jgi:hypothetical protein
MMSILRGAHLPRLKTPDKGGPAPAEQFHVQRVEMGGEDPLDHIALIAGEHVQYRTVEEEAQVDPLPLLEKKWR